MAGTGEEWTITLTAEGPGNSPPGSCDTPADVRKLRPGQQHLPPTKVDGRKVDARAQSDAMAVTSQATTIQAARKKPIPRNCSAPPKPQVTCPVSRALAGIPIMHEANLA
ncbi:hypothetical protein IWX88_001405 [Frigoribacterium sp. CG_9.8]|nr:hypothetical protein [Frigoribacterium sp. CG_9.8]